MLLAESRFIYKTLDKKWFKFLGIKKRVICSEIDTNRIRIFIGLGISGKFFRLFYLQFRSIALYFFFPFSFFEVASALLIYVRLSCFFVMFFLFPEFFQFSNFRKVEP